MSRLVFPADLLHELRRALLAREVEQCAVGFGRAVFSLGKVSRLVVREVIYPEAKDYAVQTSVAAQLRPEFVAEIGQRARRTGESIVFVHSHPTGYEEFSSIDDSGEARLREFLSQRTPEIEHASMVVTPSVIFARRLGLAEPLSVAGVGPNIIWGDNHDCESSIVFDRQIRAFGSSGQARIEATLRGLRAHTALAARQSGVISAFVRERVRVAEIHRDPNGSRRLREANRWKLARPPEESEQCLIRFANPIESRRGLYHGDLHCGNVMVRGRDAIVIDFGSMDDQGPITADAAFLEVSLVFGVDERDVDDSFDEWRDFVDELYIRQSPVVPPIHDAEHIRYAWLRKAVRELRHIGSCCGGSLDESKTVLAACLLRFARLSASEFSSPALVELSERRRAYAIVIADRICSSLFQ